MLEGMTALHTSTIDSSICYEHPVIPVHHRTGKRYIYLNRLYTTSLRQLKPDASRVLLDYLYDHCEQPEFSMRCAWSKGDLMMWDDQAVIHYGVGDYDEPRMLHRCMAVGDPPTGDPPRWSRPPRMKASSKAGMEARTGEPREAIAE